MPLFLRHDVPAVLRRSSASWVLRLPGKMAVAEGLPCLTTRGTWASSEVFFRVTLSL